MISIILPTYNRSAIINRTIDCVLNQSYTDYELIIINDCSLDDTEKVIKSYDDKRIKYVSNLNNVGCANSRYLGYQLSEGNVLVFIDDDDIWRQDKLLKQVRLIENYDMVLSDYSISINGILEQKNMRPFGEYFKQEILKRPGPFFQSIMIKKNIVDKINNPFDQKSVPSEDWNFFIELSKLELKIAYLNESLFTWNLNNDNQSLNLIKEANALSYIVEKHFDYLMANSSKKNMSNHYRRIARVYEKMFSKKFDSKNIDKYYLKAFKIYPWSFKNILYRIFVLIGYKKSRHLINLLRKLRGVKNV